MRFIEVTPIEIDSEGNLTELDPQILGLWCEPVYDGPPEALEGLITETNVTAAEILVYRNGKRVK